MKPLLLNLAIALAGMFLTGKPSPAGFALGFLAGFILLAALDRWIPGSGYPRRLIAFFWFLAGFLAEFVKSNLQLARAALFQSANDIHPDFLTYDVTGLRPMEVLILSHCITLTPGTTTVRVTDDGQSLLLHAFDARDPEAVRQSIHRSLRDPLLRWTR